MMSELEGRIREALRIVIDPELGHNIVDLGFIYGIAVTDGDARIVMTATTRGCPAADSLREGAANAAMQVSGVRSVDVTMTFDPPWAPSMIESAVRASLGFASVN